MTEAPLYEVFSSIQGEATRVGERHLFVRLAGCDLECAFCDTPASRKSPRHCNVFLPAGIEAVKNPLSADTLDAWVTTLDEETGPHHAIALTGGEPLLFADYLRPLAEGWRGRGFAILLETGGHRPDDLRRLVDVVDVVMADIKIASTAGFATEEAITRAFFEVVGDKECAAKIVVGAATGTDEIEGAARLVPGGIPLVLQPVTGMRFDPPRSEHVYALQRAAMRVHHDTRVIPQTHRTLHLR